MLLIHLKPREKDASFLSPFRRQSSPKLLLVKMVILNTKALLIHVSRAAGVHDALRRCNDLALYSCPLLHLLISAHTFANL